MIITFLFYGHAIRRVVVKSSAAPCPAVCQCYTGINAESSHPFACDSDLGIDRTRKPLPLRTLRDRYGTQLLR